MGIITHINLQLIFFILFSLSANSSSSDCIESEWEALVEFKASLIDDADSLSSWTGRDCCSWDGVKCHNLTGHVRSLHLAGFHSALSPWLFNLSHLEVLDTNSAGFKGSIPNMFEKLPSLTYLDLSSNSWDPATFPNSLCNLTSLAYLDLSASQLQGSLPSCLANLTSLATLSLERNKLSGELPGWLGHLTHLTSLDLLGNHFNSSIPSTFGNLRDLKSLILNDNQLSGTIPSTLGNLANLTDLFVSRNSLTGELSEIFFEGLTNLQQLDISDNQHLVLNVSRQWVPSFQLWSIFMDSVSIGTQFPPWLQTQTNLKMLFMSNTSISGGLPDWLLTGLPNLAYFDVSDNLLNGSIFSDNLLSGSKFDSAPLRLLYLSGNQFSGNIPYQLCNLTDLFNLYLDNNHLTGTIPSCLGTLDNLGFLHLENNRLFGHIPSELGSINPLTIHLSGNKLSGEIPVSFQNLTYLETLDLGRNELQGPIPHWIGKNWPNLQYLKLESNNFSGKIPANLCQLPSLRILNLALNNLVGTIPPCLGNLSKMLLEESDDSGTYTETLSNTNKGREMMYSSSLSYAKFMSLSGNHLHGEIPTELMNLKGLQSLNLSNNELSGTIPENINNLKHLEALDLSRNRLFGTIPQSLADIDALGYLNLSFNNFAGRIPSGNHFDTLNDPSIYEGNVGLCGKLPMMSCPGDDSPKRPVYDADADTDEEFDLLPWLYAGIGPGFAVGLVGVMCILYFKDPWRIAYFGFVDSLNNKVSRFSYS